MKLRVIKQHRTEYPNPITFTKGTRLTVGEKYKGEEDWDNCFFCTTLSHSGGWVPMQCIQLDMNSNQGIAIKDYTARELNVDIGNELLGTEVLNGWVWCIRIADNQSGWVPLSHLSRV
ncbi:SH3 domain-containing protein [Proteus terrae]|uniref:SH3 domain-containing protein n=1 Tax=Proteus terrae TaxID=1574161 RepID=UPI00217DF644|nr:SH3 domain-containing protein [Proteus terrae]MCS6716050.1 SH3 domain-containing protein [Proteus terrae]MCS6734054.1 SH3 domain-containing protein [Proteus terrae]